MIRWSWWGEELPYQETWERQQRLRAEIAAGRASSQLAMLSHRSVVTTGRRIDPTLPGKEFFKELGADLVSTDRGGLATWHGPGQLVAYCLFHLPSLKLTVRGLVCSLESGVIRWLASQGIEGARRSGYPGVWVGADKICALGLNVQRGVTTHGLALNLRSDLSIYRHFTPCGVSDGGVTSLERLLGESPSPLEAAGELAASLSEALGFELDTLEAPE